MHEYAVFNHDRSKIGRWLGFLAISLSGGLAVFLGFLQNATGWLVVGKATLATGTAYFILDYLFTRFVWNKVLLEIPNLNGLWLVDGKTIGDDGAVKYAWSGEIGIVQNWKTILVHLKTSQSQSKSYTACLFKNDGPIGGWTLSYSYKNEPEVTSAHELNAHKGYCEIQFNTAIDTASASYFNSNNRKTYGMFSLKKKV